METNEKPRWRNGNQSSLYLQDKSLKNIQSQHVYNTNQSKQELETEFFMPRLCEKYVSYLQTEYKMEIKFLNKNIKQPGQVKLTLKTFKNDKNTAFIKIQILMSA